jgi:hypothetical protein
LKLAELTIPAADMTAEVTYNSMTCNNAIALEDGDAWLQYQLQQQAQSTSN